MLRSSADSSPTEAPSSDPDSRPRLMGGWRRVFAVAGVLGVSLAFLPASAHAEPSQQDLQGKIDKLTNKAEIITERYNAQEVKLRKAKKTANRAQRRSKRLSARLDRLQDDIAAVAVNRYKTGGMQGWALMAAEDPQDFVDRATTLAHLAREKSAQIQRLKSAAQHADQAEQRAEKAAAQVKRMTKDLQQKKDRIQRLVAETKDKLEELQQQAAAPQPVEIEDVGSGVVAQVVQIALDQQGDPYVWAAEGPDAFDCSGLVYYAYGQVGISVPRSTSGLWTAGPHVSRSELQPGDLVFSSSHHVALYVGNGKVVNAPHSGTVVQVEPITEFYGAVRIVS